MSENSSPRTNVTAEDSAENISGSASVMPPGLMPVPCSVTPPAMHCVNSVPYVCDAEPGIKTYLDLPLISGRAHPEFVR